MAMDDKEDYLDPDIDGVPDFLDDDDDTRRTSQGTRTGASLWFQFRARKMSNLLKNFVVSFVAAKSTF